MRKRHRTARWILSAVAPIAVACGARSPLREIDASDIDAGDVVDVVFFRDVPDGADACVPVRDNCGMAEVCSNGLDDNCNGSVDENCACEAGRVQSCFVGPPGRRNIGACRDGSQVCLMRGTWGDCVGGIGPRPDICNGADNVCNGCSQQLDCPIMCPSPGDARVRDGRPFADYALRGADFYAGPARSWNWEVRGGPCDSLSRLPSFALRNPTAQDATLHPRLSGDYTVTLTVTTAGGMRLGCSWIVHIEGPGLRVEMCYPENELRDLDLYLHRPNDRTQWYPESSTAMSPIPTASCGWHNCEAMIRGVGMDGNPLPRADWGYMRSALIECDSGPQGAQWRALGFCGNPRLDVDNNLNEGTGLPENINVDTPRDGESFRIMVQNFTGDIARPMVNIYCGGRRIATYGAPPDEVPRFTGRPGQQNVGAMWRPADVRVHVDVSGRTTGCDVTQLHPVGATTGYDVTQGNPRY